MDFQIKITLKRFAMIAYAGSLWNRSRIYDEPFGRAFYSSTIYNLIKVVIEELKTERLPSLISNHLITAIVTLGVAAFHWYRRTRRELLNIPSEFFCKIRPELHFTVYGTIDREKLEKECIVKLEAVKANGSRQLNIFGLYYMACTSVEKSYIGRHSEEMLNFCRNSIQDNYRNSNKYDWNHDDFRRKINFILQSVLFLTNQNMRIGAGNLPYSQISRQAYMFTLAVEQAHEVAVRYYWNLLNSQEKENILIPVALSCVETFRQSPSKLARHNPNCRVDVIVFLIQRMSGYQVVDFFTKMTVQDRYKLLGGIIHSSAWEELFFPMFDLIKGQSDVDQKTFLQFTLEEIIEALGFNYRLGTVSKESICHQMFFTVWEEMKKFGCNRYDISGPKKTCLFKRCKLPIFYKNFDIQILNILLDFNEEMRKENLEVGKVYFKELIEKGQYDLIDEFMDVVLRSEEEREWFIEKQLDFLPDFKKENFGAIQKMLQWRSNLVKRRNT